MSDIITRLQHAASHASASADNGNYLAPVTINDAREAAAELTRLREENSRLLRSLEHAEKELEGYSDIDRLRQHNDALRAARDKLAREVVERRETTPERTCYEGDRFETLRGLVRDVDADPLCKEGA